MSNNNIIDGSESARAITVTGDVQQGSFSPYVAGGYSYEFDGSSAITVADSEDLRFGTNDFTVEGWVYPKSYVSPVAGIVAKRESGDYWRVALKDDGAVNIDASGGSYNKAESAAGAAPLNTWTHFALTRSGGVTKIYINGSFSGVAGSDSNDYTNTSPMSVGQLSSSGSNIGLYPFDGYISDVRVVNGTAVYTDDFTPPTEPLTLTDETVLSTCNKPYISAVGAVEQQVATGNSTVLSKIIASAPLNDEGVVYIYDEDADSTSEIKLIASGLPSNANFGNAITFTNSKLIVGDQKEGVYIYDLTAGTGSAADILNSQFKITPSISGSQVFFGYYLHADNNKLVAAAYIEGNIGAVYVYDLSAANINASEIKITPSDGVSGSSRFGNSVYIDSNKLFVGDPKGGSGSGTYTGAVYIYDLTAGDATAINNSEIKLTANDPSPVPNYLQYGVAVSSANNKLIVGAWGSGSSAPSAVYIYDLTAGDATAINNSEIKLQPSDWTSNHNFGVRMDIDGNILAVGALSADTFGAVYVYDLSAANISASEIKISPSDGVSTDDMQFGYKVSIENGKLLVGARLDDDSGFQSAGGAYLYDLTAGDATAINNSEIKLQASDMAQDDYYGSNAQLVYAELPEYALQATETSLTSTLIGNVSTERTSPYNYVDYAAASHGGSAAFDGTGDELLIAASDDFNFGTGDFTIDFWVNPESMTGTSSGTVYGSETYRISVFPSTSAYQIQYQEYGNSTQLWYDLGGSINGLWVHIALVRESGTIKLFANGLEITPQVAGGSQTANYDHSSTGSQSIGSANAKPNWNDYFTGHISDVRVVKGSAVYTADFTPPTAPLTAVTGTKLLLPFDDATIFDRTGSGIFELKGTPTISTTDSPYGANYKSLEFDGSTDYIEVDNDLLEFDGNFTLEAWIKPTSTAGQVIELANGSGIKIATNGSNYDVVFHDGSSDVITSSSSYSANAWKHVAVSRRNSTVKLFVDGTSVGSASSSIIIGSEGTTVVGAGASGTDKFTGLISDIRVASSGVYSDDFTAPSSPLTLDTSEL